MFLISVLRSVEHLIWKLLELLLHWKVPQSNKMTHILIHSIIFHLKNLALQYLNTQLILLHVPAL